MTCHLPTNLWTLLCSDAVIHFQTLHSDCFRFPRVMTLFWTLRYSSCYLGQRCSSRLEQSRRLNNRPSTGMSWASLVHYSRALCDEVGKRRRRRRPGRRAAGRWRISDGGAVGRPSGPGRAGRWVERSGSVGRSDVKRRVRAVDSAPHDTIGSVRPLALTQSTVRLHLLFY